MKVHILKDIESVHGTYRTGQVVNLPANVAEAWGKKGAIKKVAPAGKPAEIPNGMFWCDKHETLHKLDSNQGKKCNKRQVKEAEKAAETPAEVEAKARQEAEEKAEAEAEEARRLAEEESSEE